MRRRRLAVFYLIAVLLVCGVIAIAYLGGATGVTGRLIAFLEARDLYPNVLSIGRFALIEPAGWLVLLFAAAPSLAALVVVAAGDGRPGVRRLLGRMKPWRAGADRARAIRAWAVLLAAAAGGTALYLAVAFAGPAGGAAERTFAVLGGGSAAAVGTLLVGPFLDEGGLLEELGWRGFALPELLAEGAHPLRAASVLGLLWWAWHLPREVVALLAGVDPAAFLTGQATFLLLCVAMSIVIMPFWLATGGSALVGVFVHGATNMWSKALGAPMWELTGTDVRTWIVVGGAGVVLGVWRLAPGAKMLAPSDGRRAGLRG